MLGDGYAAQGGLLGGHNRTLGDANGDLSMNEFGFWKCFFAVLPALLTSQIIGGLVVVFGLGKATATLFGG